MSHQRLALTISALALCAASSCVSPRRYDEAVKSAELYQRSYHDAEQYIAELQAKNAGLREELERGGAGWMEAGSASMSDIDRRIQDLDALLSQLGRDSGDVTVHSIDGGLAYDVRESILFDSGSAEVRPEGRELLTELARDIQTRPYGMIWVRGHTDSDPVRQPATLAKFPHGNLELSAARAVSVGAFLVEDSELSERKLGVIGLGPNLPVAPNTSAENKQRNRRVEILVMEDGLEASSLGQ